QSRFLALFRQLQLLWWLRPKYNQTFPILWHPVPCRFASREPLPSRLRSQSSRNFRQDPYIPMDYSSHKYTGLGGPIIILCKQWIGYIVVRRQRSEERRVGKE